MSHLPAIKTNSAFGLDISGYSTGGSGLAKADRLKNDGFAVDIFSDHVFKKIINGNDKVTPALSEEITAIKYLIENSILVVDTPIDLQGLPFVVNPTFIWELALRPVDYAFKALPPLADKIGSPVCRFQNLLKSLPADLQNQLGISCFETYPAESLRKSECIAEKYKGTAEYRAETGWTGSPSNKPLTRRLNDRFSQLLNNLEWEMTSNSELTHDEFDAAICAITGIVNTNDLLQNEKLENEIKARVQTRLTNHHRNVPFRTNPPSGYRILTRIPQKVILNRIAKFLIPNRGLKP